MDKRNSLAGLLFSLLIAAAPAQADTLFGIYAGFGQWHHDSQGDVTAGNGFVDVDSDLALGDDEDELYYVAVEHGLPFLPNIRGQYSSISTTGTNEIGRTIDFNGVVFNPPAALTSEIDLEQTDLVLYYELLDNVVSLDVGLAARQVEGSVSLSSSLGSTEVDFDGTLPMLYSRARFDMMSGWWAAAEAMAIAYDGNQLIDGSLQLGWESPIGLGAEFGFRWFELELDDLDDIDDGQLEFSGPYAALNYHF